MERISVRVLKAITKYTHLLLFALTLGILTVGAMNSAAVCTDPPTDPGNEGAAKPKPTPKPTPQPTPAPSPNE